MPATYDGVGLHIYCGRIKLAARVRHTGCQKKFHYLLVVKCLGDGYYALCHWGHYTESVCCVPSDYIVMHPSFWRPQLCTRPEQGQNI